MKQYQHDRKVMMVVNEIIRVISPRWRMSLDRDDLLQAGRIGAWYGERHYDVGRNVPLEPYLMLCIRWSVYDELRRMDYIPRHMRDRLNNNEIESVPLSGIALDYDKLFADTPYDDRDQPYSAYAYDELVNLLIECDTGNRAGVLTTYVCGVSKSDLASIHGLSRARMGRIVDEKRSEFLQLFERRHICY